MAFGASLAPATYSTNGVTTSTISLPSTYPSWSIGMDRQFDLLKYFQSELLPKTSSYPPHNIIKISSDKFRVELAVAGFSKNEIEISVKNGVMTIKGSKPALRDDNGQFEVPDGEYVHKGIASRTFMQTFALGEYVNVVEANQKDGILSIELERILPEELKERFIEIK